MSKTATFYFSFSLRGGVEYANLIKEDESGKKMVEKVKELVLDFLKEEEVKIFLFGSRARGEETLSSDVDIGIIPKKAWNKTKLTLLREALENTNIPCRVELVEFAEVSEDFKKHALKDTVVWKD